MPDKADRDKRKAKEEEPEERPAEEPLTDEELFGDELVTDEPLDFIEGDDVDVDADLAREEAFDTRDDDDDATYNPWLADDQGLTYIPPSDAPVVPSEDDLQGAEVGAGFAPEMEEANPDEEDLPEAVDRGDADIEEDIYTALRDNSETTNLNDIIVQVNNGIVTLWGTVDTEDDIGRVDDVVAYLDGVMDVENHLQVREEE